jgi:excisionase family DNA binding protein
LELRKALTQRTTNAQPAGFLTLDQVARMLAVDAKTVEGLVESGELRAVRVAGQLRVSPVALEQFLAAAEVEPHGKP